MLETYAVGQPTYVYTSIGIDEMSLQNKQRENRAVVGAAQNLSEWTSHAQTIPSCSAELNQ